MIDSRRYYKTKSGKRLNTSTYQAWIDMKRRCTNKKLQNYKYYGKRGITVCKRWLKFNNFYTDMGKKPSKDLSLDRIDSNKNYCKKNCRWATKSVQNINKRKLPNTSSKYRGVYQDNGTIKPWRARISVDNIRINVGSFSTEKEAALAYNKYVLKYYGKDISLNKIKKKA